MINRVIFIGNDKSILTGENSDARERMRLIASHFEKLTIIIFTLKEDRLKPLQEKNLEIIPTNSENRWSFVLDALKIVSQRHDIDLISTQDPFIAGLVGVLAKLYFKIKLNIQIHNDFFGSNYFRYENLQNYIFYWLGKFNLLFTNSIRIVNKRLLNDKRCFVVPVATDLDFFWAPPRSNKFNQIICVARLAKQKNLPLLFDAAKSFPDLKFVIVGEGEERKYLEKIRPTNVVLVGQKNREEVKKIYNQSDIFVLPSNYEGWGITVVEALASGLPVIMTNTGCAKDLDTIIIKDKKTLVTAIKYLLSNPEKSKKLVLESQKIIKSMYTRDILVSQFINGLKFLCH